MLNDGGLAVVPTDTVYGVGASLEFPNTIQRIFEVKGRPSDKPLPVLIAEEGAVSRFAAQMSPAARRLMDTFWPGPMTIILQANDNVPTECLAGGSTVGLRIPDHDALRRLISKCGGALTVTSANRSGQSETTSASRAVSSLAGQVDIALDLGQLPGGHASTVVDLSSDSARIVRHGAICAEQIQSVLSSRESDR